ncbi:MAG: Crp/Fnr family transcriptional regulator [Reichenbachiella sp.]|uniref:Crp/Fnr family transcriptional regulator n=1 Tax=Reichenbachiella sp. TaxID=2184521 RepID=UPI003297C2CE
MLLNKEYQAFIDQVFLDYHALKQETLDELYAMAKIKTLSKNEFLLRVGSTAKEVYILKRGAIIAYFLDTEGNTYNKNIFLEGNLVGSTVSYLTNTPSRFALEAIEDCEIISFNYLRYRQLINESVDFKNFYIAYLEKNWVIEKEKREIDIVMTDATARYQELLASYPGLDKRIPLVHIASHLGITPTQLSRIRKKIQ